MPSILIRDAAELYNQYHRIVYAYLLRLTGSQDAAEELMQETFYRAIRGAGGYRGDCPPTGWLCTIARRLYVDQVRRWSRDRDRRGEVEWATLPDLGEGPESAALRREQRERIARVMQSLPETNRMALLLRDADGLPYETIAEILGMSLANVKVTIHRARLRFRAAYEGGNEQ